MDFDKDLRERWRTTIFQTPRLGFPYSCKIAGVSDGGYVVAGQGIDPAPSVTATRLNTGGEIIWTFVEPPSETSYTWHWKIADFKGRENSYFMLTELLNPPSGGRSSSRVGLLHFRVSR
jgi:hypothetical protein